MMDCVRQHNTVNQITTEAATDVYNSTNVFADLAFSNDPPRHDDDDPTTSPNPDQPTWLAYGNCHSCQAQLTLSVSTFQQQQKQQKLQYGYHDRHKLQKVGSILSFLGAASFPLGLYNTLMYSMYLIGKQQQNDKRGNKR